MNAIAQDMEGDYIDPFNGQADIAAGIIRAVGDPMERMQEDALRAVRAIRFSITKRMAIDPGLRFAIQVQSVLDMVASEAVSDERIDEELRRMFAFDTVATLKTLVQYQGLTDAMLAGSVSITSTMKTIKTRG
jgi:tRNA nucleotidyltransferase (CCA-adding enzyme)